MPESPRETEGTVVRFFSPENYKTFFNLFRKPREAGRKNLLLLMVCEGIMFLTGLGIDGIQRLYVEKNPYAGVLRYLAITPPLQCLSTAWGARLVRSSWVVA